MPKIQILYLVHHRHTHAQIQKHAHTCTETLAHIDTDTHRHIYTEIHKHTCKHTQTHAYLCTVYTNTHTCTHMHTDVHVRNLRKLLLQIHFEAKISKNYYCEEEIATFKSTSKPI